MSRKASRAAVAARRKAIAVRRERAQRTSAESPGDGRPRAARTPSRVPAVARPTGEARLWNALLIGGAAVATGLLGRQVADMFADHARPKLLQNDTYSALGSLALLVIIGVFAYNRWRRRVLPEDRA